MIRHLERLDHFNIVAYLTSEEFTRPPRIGGEDLAEVLEDLSGWGPELKLESESEPAQECLGRLRSLSNPRESPLPDEHTRRVLIPLRNALRDFKFFALFVGEPHDLHRLKEKASSAPASKLGAYFLSTSSPDPETFPVDDPFDPTLQLAQHLDVWPGVLVWTRDGDAAFVSLDWADGILADLNAAAESPRELQWILGSARRETSPMCTLLHLSDTHFGGERATENKRYLQVHIRRLRERINAVVITGDLCNHPKRAYFREFQEFKDSLKDIVGDKVYWVPGNHDQRYYGSTIRKIGQSLSLLPKMDYTRFEADRDLRCVFFGFNSALTGSVAAGEIETDELTDRACEFEIKCSAEKEVESYMRIALLHHHPADIPDTSDTTGLRIFSHLLRPTGTIAQLGLRLQDPEEFQAWCAGRGVSLVLHGHMHMQRVIPVPTPDVRGQVPWAPQVTAIGCGSSTAHHTEELSYNLIRFDPDSRRWAATFYSDPCDASGFRPQCVSIHTE